MLLIMSKVLILTFVWN